MVKCYHCGEEIIGDSFNCTECGQDYCLIHKEPVIHECNIVKENAILHQAPTPIPTYAESSQTQYVSTDYGDSTVRGTTDGSFTWHRQDKHIPENAFDKDSGIDFKGILFPHRSEFLHLLIGGTLIFIIGLVGFYDPRFIEMGLGWAIFMLAGFYTTAFLFHEFGHRQVAIHFGLQTKFRLLTFGMVITIAGLFLSLASRIYGSIALPALALPGAVVVLGLDKIDKKTGLCKAAGPTVNLVYGSILLIISFMMPNEMYPLNLFIGYAAALNFSLGLFNMIPIGILDGQNIFKWSKLVYFFLFGSLVLLTAYTYYNLFDQSLYF